MIGVVGSGVMGAQISAYLLGFEYTIIVKIGDYSRCDVILEKIKKLYSKNNPDKEFPQHLIEFTDKFESLVSCSIILESSKEDVSYKKTILNNISKYCSEDTLVASNTSSISIVELANSYKYPSNVIGCHFFNPIFKMDLVEVIITHYASSETINKIIEFTKTIKKVPIIVKDSPGFVVNRLLLPQINDAIRLVESGVASMEDIDSAIKLGLHHPMGPFALADYIGLDVCYNILYEICHNTNNLYY